PCDVTSKQQVDALADRVVDDLGRADVLINSAGMAYRSPAEEFPEEEFDRIIAINLKGTYLPCQAFGRKMLAQGSGSIVNLASIGAFIAYPHASAYNASKGGVLNLTRILALEWVDRGVRVPLVVVRAVLRRVRRVSAGRRADAGGRVDQSPRRRAPARRLAADRAGRPRRRPDRRRRRGRARCRLRLAARCDPGGRRGA